MRKIIVAIDGSAATGKSTQAKKLASHLGYAYIDSGAMYRAVTLFALKNNWISERGFDVNSLIGALSEIDIQFKSHGRVQKTYLNDLVVEKSIRSELVADFVSQVSTLPEVRAFLVKKQREYGKNKGIVMDGRDIGTVVFPYAECKFFLYASPEIRAKRRWEELKIKGNCVAFESVLDNVKHRDKIDSNRSTSPLQQAGDAITIDVSNLTIEEVFQKLIKIVKTKINA